MILVAGGTGRLGSLVVHRLADRGLQVRVLTRDASRAAHLVRPGVEVVIGDVRDAGSLVPAFAGATTVVSAVHGFAGPGRVSPATVDRDGNAHLVDAARAAQAEVVLLSIVGAEADSPMELFQMKHAAERYLRDSAVASTVVRATAFLELWVELLERTSVRT
ncbi:MAG: NAD(P)H-binding protein, partial [Actinomycetota bacterium]|nr:NAD(P)H-binding protein [Actinomycetota bacterium]